MNPKLITPPHIFFKISARIFRPRNQALSLGAALFFAATLANATSFTPGNLAVLQVGDGSAPLTSAATNVFVLELTTSGSLVQSIAIPTSGGNVMSCIGSSGTEGYLGRSTNGGLITFAGYAIPPGLTNAATSNATIVARCEGSLDASGTFTRGSTGSTTMFSGSNARSAVSDGINFWLGGTGSATGNQGIWYSANGGTPTQINPGNYRVVKIYNGSLYFSTGAGTRGIYSFSGFPTTTTTPTLVMAGGTGSSFEDFAINPAGTVAYITDDGTFGAAGGGIQKWTFNGGIWSSNFTFGSANNLPASGRALAVDFSGPNPVLYFTTTQNTNLYSLTDTSAFSDTSDTTDQATLIAVTGTANKAFRGVNFAPVSVLPSISAQPIDTNILAGSTVTLSVGSAGTSPLSYQWYYPNLATPLSDGSSGFGGTISGATTANLTLANVNSAQAGGYQVIVSNLSGSVTSRVAQLTVTTVAVRPIITNQPANLTVTAGDPATFSVVAGGTSPLAYQWKVDDGVTTNNVAGAGITGTNTATLSISAATLSMSGLRYFVTITNTAGVTNSSKALLTVNPPPTISISQFRSKVDGTFAPTNTTTLYTLTGIVTTWTNMTTSTTATEFYMQDDSGGIAVFWSGAAPNTNLPAAGSRVSVTGPMAAFNGLLEISPVYGNALHSVTVLSTNNPLPKAQPLAFDPNVTGYPGTAKTATMHALESMYFVASNVMLNFSTPNFVSGANDIITNNTHKVLAITNSVLTVNFTNEQGQQYILFINASTDIPNKAKYTGPVTIYGVLGYFTSAGFEFTPSRYADIIPYTRSTNVLQNLTRLGDAPTNSYTESVLRPGENLTTSVSVSDPEGGVVTLTPITDGLPGSANWTGVTSGANASATFHFAPTTGDAGTNYVISLGATSTSGMNITNTWYVYVPTAQEQSVFISEFLANPTTNSSAAYFNPLHRDFDTNNIGTNNQYVEIVNVSGLDLDLYGWSITDAAARRHTFLIGAPNEQLASVSSNTVVIYGGPRTSDPQPPHIPVPSFPANVGNPSSLSLATNGTGVIILRNPKYYNDGLGIQPGYIVDRVVYSASDISTNGSLSRFPMPNGKLAFVPQAYVSTNATTAGLQYDGSSWLSPIQTPHTVSNVTVTAGNPLTLSFTANPSLMTTLWKADNILDSFKASGGQKFGTTSGTFSITNLPPAMQFYYLTTQTNQ